ncbi:hypothetical protein WIW50_16515 [Flavobacteriaceae bacterium 3-367]
MDYLIYIALVVLGLIFMVVFTNNRKRAKRRKSRKFMDGYGGDSIRKDQK